MKNIFLLSLVVILSFSCKSDKKAEQKIDTETTVYYLIRHAEKDRGDATNKDPELTDIGIQRAKNWAKHFETIELDQIYSTDYKRTQQTAMFTATDQNIPVESYDSNTMYNEDFKLLTADKTVLIVGHSNTTPEFVNMILGQDKYPHIEDNNNGNLYIITIKGDEISASLEKYN